MFRRNNYRPEGGRPNCAEGSALRYRQNPSTFPRRGAAPLKTQHGLGDYVALNLVRTAIDRRLAHVEIHARGPDRVFRPHGILVVAEPVRIGIGVIADSLERQLGDALLDFRPLDLENGTLGSGMSPACFRGERAQ